MDPSKPRTKDEIENARSTSPPPATSTSLLGTGSCNPVRQQKHQQQQSKQQNITLPQQESQHSIHGMIPTTIPEEESQGSPDQQKQLHQQYNATHRDSTTGRTPEHEISTNPLLLAQQQQQARYNPANYPAAIKLLVSNNAAGSIIGRSGQTISDLQSQSNTRIKLSQSGEYYPGTQDRVCLIQGDGDDIKSGTRLLLERMYTLLEHQHYSTQHQTLMSRQILEQQQQQQQQRHQPQQPQQQQQQQQPSSSTILVPFDFIVRLLVPITACGMIIGKSGSNIKYLEETSGVASVRLSPKNQQQQILHPEQQIPVVVVAGSVGPSSAAAAAISNTMERIVTISGHNLESCIYCLHLIIDGMVANPDTSRYTNLTTGYSTIVNSSAQQQQQQQQHMGVLGMGSGIGSIIIPSYSSQQQPLDSSINSNLLLHTPDTAHQHQSPVHGVVNRAIPASSSSSSSKHSYSPPMHEQRLWDDIMGTTSPFSQSKHQHYQHQEKRQGITTGMSRRYASSPNLPVTTGGGAILEQHLHRQQLQSSGSSRLLSGTDTPPTNRTDRFGAFAAGSAGGYYEAAASALHYSSMSLQQITHHHQGSLEVTGIPLYGTSSNVEKPLYLIQHPSPLGIGVPTGINDPLLLSTESVSNQNHHQVSHSASAPNLLAMQLEASSPLTQTPSTKATTSPHLPGSEYTSFTNAAFNLVPQAPTMVAPGCFSAQVLIPDSMIGSILGRGGKTLTELQMVSATRIRISQRGEYMPGTRDSRIVTIRGPTAQAVWQVQFMMSQRMMIVPKTATTAVSTASTPLASNTPLYFPTTTIGPRGSVSNNSMAGTAESQQQQLIPGQQYNHQKRTSTDQHGAASSSTATTKTTTTALCSDMTTASKNNESLI